MLEFFRKFQSYIFLFVTVIIVISFSFFGTYQSIVSHPVKDEWVFTAVDGERIYSTELNEMVSFLKTDNRDKQLFGGAFGPNFLNDGVIRNDILSTGLGTILAQDYLTELARDLDTRLEKEKAYSLYIHPQAKFISQEAVYALYAPEINEHFNNLKKLSDNSSKDAFETRVQLFLNEMNFPGFYVRSLLNSQEKQYRSLPHDSKLDYTDFSLFGHHTVEDWFGSRFINLASQFIINAAKIAEQKGYKVTREEALADLLRNSEISYNQNLNNPNLAVLNRTEYFNEQLRLLGMDQNQAAKTWRQVLLFRRLFDDAGTAVFIDPLAIKTVKEYANQKVEGNFYHLPKELQFSNYLKMQKFEVYLDQIRKKTAGAIAQTDRLLLPESFLTPKEVARRTPELVQKRYLISFKQANKNQLLSKVTLKESWNYEIDHFDLLKEKFPELALYKVETREDKLAALDRLNDQIRVRVDLFARKEIVDSHPEWLTETLDQAKSKITVVGLTTRGNQTLFEGLENGEELMRQLDLLAIKKREEGENETINEQEKIDPSTTYSLRFTADNIHYYLIEVLDRDEEGHILTFEEALKGSLLDKLLDQKLKAHFEKNKALKNWNSFIESKEQVADDYFSDLLKAIAASRKEDVALNGTLLAPYRFYAYMEKCLKEAEESKNEESFVANEASKVEVSDLNSHLEPVASLKDQWKLKKKSMTLSRFESTSKEVFNLNEGQWSTVVASQNGELSFFHRLKNENALADLQLDKELIEKMEAIRTLIGNEAKVHLMKNVVGEIQEKGSISLVNLNSTTETLDLE